MNRPKKQKRNSHRHHDHPAESWQVGSLRQGGASSFSDPARGELYRAVAHSLDGEGETGFASFHANPVAWATRYGAALVSRCKLEAPIVFFGRWDGDVVIAIPPEDLCEECCCAAIEEKIRDEDGGVASYLVLEKGTMRKEGDDKRSDSFVVTRSYAGSTTTAVFVREYGVGPDGKFELGDEVYLIGKYPSLWKSGDGFAEIGEPVESDLSFEALKSGCQELADMQVELEAGGFQDKALQSQYNELRDEVVPLVAGLVDLLARSGLVSTCVWDDDVEKFVGFAALCAVENAGLHIECSMDVIENSCPPPDLTPILNELEESRQVAETR